jgi:hypothetical protein
MSPARRFLLTRAPPLQVRHGTAARIWLHMLTCFVACTTVTAGAPIAERVISIYSGVLRTCERRADTLAFRMNSRKIALHTADHVDRIGRQVLGADGVEVRPLCSAVIK